MSIMDQSGKFEPSDFDFQPNYHLSPEEMSTLEQQMITDAREIAPDGVVVAWVSPTSPYSNLLRTKEASHFPEVADTDIYYELNQVYLAITDTRDSGSVAHAAAITFFDTSDESVASGKTGFYTVDSLIEHGNFTQQDFVKYYEALGLSMNTSISIETNFKINPDMPDFNGLGSADLAYVAILQWVTGQGWSPDRVGIFATINEKQIGSLERVGIKTTPLMGRTDLRTEEEELGKYSLPVLVNYKDGAEVVAAFGLSLPEITYEH